MDDDEPVNPLGVPVPDPVLAAVADAVGRAHAGDRASAGRRLEQLWATVGADGDALHRCAIAHALADLQDDPEAERRWDERALESSAEVTDDRVALAGMLGTAQSLAPSLHLNLADVHRRLGDADAARASVARGRAALDAVPAGGYRDQIAEALTRVEREVGAE